MLQIVTLSLLRCLVLYLLQSSHANPHALQRSKVTIRLWNSNINTRKHRKPFNPRTHFCDKLRKNTLSQYVIMRNLHLSPRTRNITTGLKCDQAAATCVKWSTIKKKKKKKKNPSMYFLMQRRSHLPTHSYTYLQYANCRKQPINLYVYVCFKPSLTQWERLRGHQLACPSLTHTHTHTHQSGEGGMWQVCFHSTWGLCIV